MIRKISSRIDKWLPWIAFGHDVIMSGVAYVLAMYLRVGGEAFTTYRGPLLDGLPLYMASAALAFRIFDLYRGLWRYASFRDLTSVIKAILLSLAIFLPVMFLANRLVLFPRQVLAIQGLVLMVLLGGPRILYRGIKDRITGGGRRCARRSC